MTCRPCLVLRCQHTTTTAWLMQRRNAEMKRVITALTSCSSSFDTWARHYNKMHPPTAGQRRSRAAAATLPPSYPVRYRGRARRITPTTFETGLKQRYLPADAGSPPPRTTSGSRCSAAQRPSVQRTLFHEASPHHPLAPNTSTSLPLELAAVNQRLREAGFDPLPPLTVRCFAVAYSAPPCNPGRGCQADCRGGQAAVGRRGSPQGCVALSGGGAATAPAAGRQPPAPSVTARGIPVQASGRNCGSRTATDGATGCRAQGQAAGLNSDAL